MSGIGAKGKVETVSGFNLPTHDYGERTATDSTSDTYTLYVGGDSGGTEVGTLVLTYVDASKEALLSWAVTGA